MCFSHICNALKIFFKRFFVLNMTCLRGFFDGKSKIGSRIKLFSSFCLFNFEYFYNGKFESKLLKKVAYF